MAMMPAVLVAVTLVCLLVAPGLRAWRVRSADKSAAELRDHLHPGIVAELGSRSNPMLYVLGAVLYAIAGLAMVYGGPQAMVPAALGLAALLGMLVADTLAVEVDISVRCAAPLSFGAVLPEPHQPTGDTVFDAAVHVSADSPTVPPTYFDVETRKAVLALVAHGGRCVDGVISLSSTLPSSPAAARALANDFNRVANRLRRARSPDVLIERAVSDPVSGVRVRTLVALEQRQWHNDLFAAHRALLHAHPDADLGDDPAVDHALLEQLAHDGTVGEIPRLRAYADVVEGDLRRRADGAIAAIQSRVEDAAAGGLSIAEGGGKLTAARAREGSVTRG